ncbi:MAG: hypothetical protein IT472_08970 [Thermomonas sp.]|uniref:hypothetical protein n=1 Tax=Thermomonas sp. TaxID=1971895 RepID=UPI0026118877|nr:hypothetical protein [Thermomonas sp.]MCC7097297.1 hypothetical protein [Thermomonas sp.]
MSARRRKGDAHGLTAREAEVMDRFDGGEACTAIARKMGLPLIDVSKIVGRYYEGDETRLAHAAIADASNRLGAAITAMLRSAPA